MLVEANNVNKITILYLLSLLFSIYHIIFILLDCTTNPLVVWPLSSSPICTSVNVFRCDDVWVEMQIVYILLISPLIFLSNWSEAIIIYCPFFDTIKGIKVWSNDLIHNSELNEHLSVKILWQCLSVENNRKEIFRSRRTFTLDLNIWMERVIRES